MFSDNTLNEVIEVIEALQYTLNGSIIHPETKKIITYEEINNLLKDLNEEL